MVDEAAKVKPAKPESLIGQTIGDRYEIIAPIGEGGFAVVYKGRHKLMNRLVAVKLMYPPRTDAETAMKRFQQEAQAASCLMHTNLVTALDFGFINDEQPYFVMDFVEGKTLATVLNKTGFLNIDEALDIFIQACEGIAHAHDNGVIHRDLKPSNIMLVTNKAGQQIVKIVDFGVAKMILDDGAEMERLTRSGETFGTSLYMSPEQCAGKPLDYRSDIYSFGVVMYETLTGMPPFIGQNVLDTMQKHINEKAPLCAESRGDLFIPAKLENIVQKALAKKPEMRYQSMRELKTDLEEVRRLIPQTVTASKKTIDPANKQYKVLAAVAIVALGIVGGTIAYLAKARTPDVQISPPSTQIAMAPSAVTAPPAQPPAAVTQPQPVKPALPIAQPAKVEPSKVQPARVEPAKVEPPAQVKKPESNKSPDPQTEKKPEKKPDNKAEKKPDPKEPKKPDLKEPKKPDPKQTKKPEPKDNSKPPASGKPVIASAQQPAAVTATPRPVAASAQPATGTVAQAPAAQVDFGPYIARVQRKLHRTWRPPSNVEIVRPVTVTFKITRDGGITGLKLLKGSRKASAEGQAAVKAVETAAPFPPLPPGAPGDVEIEFTFDQ